MANLTNDPRFAEHKPDKCKSCGNPLQFAFEIENGNLCSNCGPGSLKWQKAEDKKNDTDFIEQSEQYNRTRGRHLSLANSVRKAMNANFDEASRQELRLALEADDKLGDTGKHPGEMNSNAEATEERMRHTINPQDEARNARDSRENEPEEHDASFQTKDL